jgi:hypothetical protein
VQSLFSEAAGLPGWLQPATVNASIPAMNIINACCFKLNLLVWFIFFNIKFVLQFPEVF